MLQCMQISQCDIPHTKDKKHMIISIDAREAYDNIQHPFMLRTPTNVGIEGSYLSILKAIHDKSIASIILNNEKLKVFLLKSGTRTYTFTSFNQDSIGSPTTHGNQLRKRNKCYPNGKEEVKLSLHADVTILYI